jgi:hypothetical protein
LVRPTFDKLDEFDGGMAAACLDGKAGYITPEGVWIVEPKYDRCYRFVHSLAVVVAGANYSYISRKGTTVWTSEAYAYPQAAPYRE